MKAHEAAQDELSRLLHCFTQEDRAAGERGTKRLLQELVRGGRSWVVGGSRAGLDTGSLESHSTRRNAVRPHGEVVGDITGKAGTLSCLKRICP